jgi:hypothetical protein
MPPNDKKRSRKTNKRHIVSSAWLEQIRHRWDDKDQHRPGMRLRLSMALFALLSHHVGMIIGINAIENGIIPDGITFHIEETRRVQCVRHWANQLMNRSFVNGTSFAYEKA